MKISGNNILITGGATGIGFALAERFFKAGNIVTICGRREAVLEEAAQKCPGLKTIVCDVGQEAAREELMKNILHDQPHCNVLINNAGIQNRPSKIVEPQQWSRHQEEIRINFEAPLHLSLLMAKHLSQQKDAAIINITSGLAFVPLAFMPTYCATKAALHSITQSLRYQLSPLGVSVIEIAPPAVNTDLGGKGLHDFGVPLNEFADFAFQKIANGAEEFGYLFSEAGRVGNFEERTELFKKMNSTIFG